MHMLHPYNGPIRNSRSEYNDALGVVETVAAVDPAEPLVRSARATRAQTLRNFISANENVFGIRSLDQLKKTADYTNPDGNLSFVRFEQRVDDIPVFAAEVTAGFSKRNEMFRVINSLAPDVKTPATEFGDPENAVTSAASHIGIVPREHKTVPERNLRRLHSPTRSPPRNSTSRSATACFARHGEFCYGPPESAYYVIVDVDGTLLWRNNITAHQTISATYNVYGNNFTSLMKTADSPSPFTPGCLAPTGCAQPPAIARTNFTLIGNEARIRSIISAGSLIPGLPVRTPADPNITDGNNVEAGIDRDGVQGVDVNGWATGSPNRVLVTHTIPHPAFRHPAKNRPAEPTPSRSNRARHDSRFLCT